MSSFILALLYHFLLSIWPKSFKCIKNLKEQHGTQILKLFRTLERESLHVQKIRDDIIFLERCQLYNLIPTFCKLNSHHRTFFSSSDYNGYLKKCLSNELSSKHRTLQFRLRNERSLRTELRTQLPLLTYIHCSKVIKDRVNCARHSTQARHNRKISKLKISSGPDLPSEKVLVNLSSKNLSEAERVLLSKGLSFSVTPSNLNPLEIKTSFENFYSQCPEQACHDSSRLKHKLRDLCYRYIYGKNPTHCDNLSKQERVALQTLLKEKDIVICKPDKGNGVVVLDRTQYVEKLKIIVNDTSKFQKINEEPTARREGRLQRYLLRLHKKGALNQEEYNQIRPSGSAPARMYGLPKIHKDNVPLRPIVSSIGTYNYNLAKFLVTLLQPISKSQFCIKDSFAFAREIQNAQSIPFMCSFDVKSLFTNVPLLETIDICVQKLFQHQNDLVHGMSSSEFRYLLLSATKDSHFLFNGDVYDQIDGVAMGSPLGPVLADIFMSWLEEDFMNKYSGEKPVYYRRYVDDTFLVFNTSTDALSFFAFVNAQHPNIAFTMECEESNSLPFLDVKVTRTCTGIETSLYRKTSFSGLYQKWNSCVPKSFKRSLVHGLFYRAWTICSSRELFDREVCIIRQFLRQNGYPSKFLNNCLLAFLKKRESTPQPTLQPYGPNKKQVFLTLPYAGPRSDVLRRQMHRVISTALPCVKPVVYFSSSFQLKSLSKLKDKIPILSRSRVVYKLNCPTCNEFYIGQTSRRLGQRMNEHRTHTNGPIRNHQDLSGHIIDTNTPEVISSDHHTSRLLIKETLLIREQGADRSLNGNIGTGKLRLW